VVCECCFESFLHDDICRCSAGHRFCQQCLVRAIETVLGEGRSEVRCLAMGGCTAAIVADDLFQKVPDKTLRRLIVAQAEAAVRESGAEPLVKCHHCGFVVISDRSGVFHCPECGSNTCTGCGRIAHEGLSCEQAAGMGEAEVRVSEAVVRVCPKCDAHFVKDEGCNKMECPRCHTWICYWCRKIIPKDVGYAHFWRAQTGCPPDKCPLWVANDTLNRIQAARAGLGMVDIPVELEAGHVPGQ
jgi:TRIAD3 protein (E3 ubiquitin-protein ligase RNF216)